MLANQAAMEAGPAELALDIVARMETLAESGEWGRIERLAARLRGAILETPVEQRQAVLVAARRCVERIQSKALGSRNDTREKLSEIRRGRVAARAYGQPERQENADASLR